MNSSTPEVEPKAEWKSVCCNTHGLGDLSREWWEIKPGGEGKLLREGLCARCNQIAHFEKQ